MARRRARRARPPRRRRDRWRAAARCRRDRHDRRGCARRVAFAHWVSRGDGSGLRGHALIDALIAVGRHLPGLSTARLPSSGISYRRRGALSWIATGLHGAGDRTTRIVAAVSVVSVAASLVAFGFLVGFAHLGIGSWLAVAGAAALVIGSWLIAPSRPRRCPIGQNDRPGPVAQWSEQGTHNPSVEGSIPSRPTLSTRTNAIQVGEAP